MGKVWWEGGGHCSQQTTEIEIKKLFNKHLHQVYTKSVNEVNESVNEM